MARADALIPLSGRNFNPVGAFQDGRERKRRRELEELAGIRAENQDKRAASEESRRSEQFDLAKEDRESAQLAAADEAEFDSILGTAVELDSLLSTDEGVPMAIEMLDKRAADIIANGGVTGQGNANDTLEVRELLKQGNVNQARALLKSTLAIGERFGRLSRSSDGTPAAISNRRDLQSGFSDDEVARANRIEAGLSPRAGESKEERIARDVELAARVAASQGRIAGSVETAKQGAQIEAIPDKVKAEFDAEFKAEAPKRIRAANDAIARIDSVMEEAGLAIEDVGVTTTGLLGQINSKIAGTTAFSLARKIDTIQANLSFDRIAEMRKNSPTGGALGQVSERELSLLGAAVVALDQANEEGEVRRAFEKVLLHYSNWKGVITGQKDADVALSGDVPETPTEQTPVGETVRLKFDAQGNPVD